jgi:hypothetical protein
MTPRPIFLPRARDLGPVDHHLGMGRVYRVRIAELR